MPDEHRQLKDGWDKLHIGAQALIPLVAAIFTIVFSTKEQKNQTATIQLAASNYELAKSQVKVSLLPLLSSENERQRDMALKLAETLDELFAADVARIIALNDSSKNVRQSARSVLGSLSQSLKAEVRQKAKKGVDQYDIMNELRTKGLLKKLNDAQGYVDGGALNGDEEALKLYHEVINQLSQDALSRLNKDLLAAAQKDDKEGNTDQAARKYQALFADYRQMVFDE